MAKPFGIYIHIPFCVQKCAYCDFVSFPGCDHRIKIEYMEALKREIRLKMTSDILDNPKEDFDGKIVDTIYIGGGTPSTVLPQYIGEVLDEIRNKYTVAKDAEITIEVNPGTVTKEMLNEYRSFGINRISMGLQSSEDELLKLLGRIHDFEDFRESFRLAKNAGFRSINVDLMVGLPYQTGEDINNTLVAIKSMFPDHVSLYSLINEEGTPLTKKIEKGEVPECDENLERQMYWLAKSILEKAGYHQYEISNFARAGRESKHNLNCWNQENYIGYGLASHSYYENVRFSNTINLDEYIDKVNLGDIKGIIHIEEIQDEESKEKEYVILGLRKIKGVDRKSFQEKFGKDMFEIYKNEIEKLVKEGLIVKSDNGIALSNKGLDFANLVFEEFV